MLLEHGVRYIVLLHILGNRQVKIHSIVYYLLAGGVALFHVRAPRSLVAARPAEC